MDNTIEKIDKEKAFDELAKLFYERNFGTASKAEIELLMFRFLVNAAEKEDMTSDYRLSKILGITQQRVRNLKVKKELAFPSDNDGWKYSFAKLLDDNSKHTIFENGRMIMNISDPVLFIEIQNFIEENGGFTEYHLNPKILDIRIEYLLDFAVLFEKENADAVFENAAEMIRKKNRNAKVLSIGREVIQTGTDIAGIIGVFSPENLVIKTIKKILM